MTQSFSKYSKRSRTPSAIQTKDFRFNIGNAGGGTGTTYQILNNQTNSPNNLTREESNTSNINNQQFYSNVGMSPPNQIYQ
jgi:hypothetical protein